jgi:hypothetical protein
MGEKTLMIESKWWIKHKVGVILIKINWSQYLLVEISVFLFEPCTFLFEILLVTRIN